jgi:hypothetical protein
MALKLNCLSISLFAGAAFVAAGPAYSQGRAVNSPCLFGETVSELLKNKKDFRIKESAFKTLKQSRVKGYENQLLMVDVSVVQDRATKRVFHVNATYNHVDDGDNSWGWIEEVTGAEEHAKRLENGQDDPSWRAVVAEISDSDIGKCSFTKR